MAKKSTVNERDREREGEKPAMCSKKKVKSDEKPGLKKTRNGKTNGSEAGFIDSSMVEIFSNNNLSSLMRMRNAECIWQE